MKTDLDRTRETFAALGVPFTEETHIWDDGNETENLPVIVVRFGAGDTAMVFSSAPFNHSILGVVRWDNGVRDDGTEEPPGPDYESFVEHGPRRITATDEPASPVTTRAGGLSLRTGKVVNYNPTMGCGSIAEPDGRTWNYQRSQCLGFNRNSGSTPANGEMVHFVVREDDDGFGHVRHVMHPNYMGPERSLG